MHARGSGEAARRAKRGRQPEKKKESLSFLVPLPSRAINHARGHLLARVLLDGLQKKERLLVVCTKDHWTSLKKVLGTIAFATARVADTQRCCKRISDWLTER